MSGFWKQGAGQVSLPVLGEEARNTQKAFLKLFYFFHVTRNDESSPLLNALPEMGPAEVRGQCTCFDRVIFGVGSS